MKNRVKKIDVLDKQERKVKQKVSNQPLKKEQKRILPDYKKKTLNYEDIDKIKNGLLDSKKEEEVNYKELKVENNLTEPVINEDDNNQLDIDNNEEEEQEEPERKSKRFIRPRISRKPNEEDKITYRYFNDIFDY